MDVVPLTTESSIKAMFLFIKEEVFGLCFDLTEDSLQCLSLQ